MKKSAHRLILISCLMAIAGVYTIIAKPLVIKGASSVLDLVTTSGIKLTNEYKVPLETEIVDSTKGVLLTSTKEGSSLSFINEFCGEFSLDFRVFCDNAAHVSSLDSSPDNNYDLREICFTFTDTDTNESFEVFFNGGGNYYAICPQARVKLKNFTCAYWYNKGVTSPTKVYQKSFYNYYTVFYGTSFCNQAYYANSFKNDTIYSSNISFNPDTMELYGYNYNEYTGVKERRVILDLDDPELYGDRNAISSRFENYKVKLSFSKINTDRTAKMILYSLNGQSLGNRKLADNSGVSYAFKSKQENGIINNKMILDLPSNTYDVILGNKPFNGNISITTPSKEIINLSNNEFTPSEVGNHIATYSMTDANNQTSSYERKFYVYNKKPDIEINYNCKLDKNTVVGKNSKVEIPNATIYNPITDNNQIIEPSIYHNGEKINANNDSLNLENGNYSLKYEYEYFDDVICDVYDFIVNDSYPKVDIKNDIETLKYQSSYEINNYDLENVSISTTYPDGKVVSGANLYLKDIGQYRISYKQNNKEVLYKYFDVKKAADDLFICDENSYIENNCVSPENYDYTYKGAKVTATKDQATITYNGILDVSKNTIDDTLVELLVLAKEDGKNDFSSFYITMTDIYDESNYISICLRDDFWGNLGRTLLSAKTSSMNDYMAQREIGDYRTGIINGTYIFFSFRGKFAEHFRMTPFSLYYDNEEKALYASVTMYAYETAKDRHLVCDFDDPNFVGADNVWKGFTTGEIKLSISAGGLASGSASYILGTINNQKLGNDFIDNPNRPTFISSVEDENNLPYGIVNEKYNYFDVSAFSVIDGKMKPEIQVYKKDENNALIRLSSNDVKDSYFIPKEKGKYVIKYTAKTSYGSFETKEYEIDVYDTVSNPTISFNNPISSQMHTGQEIDFSNYVISNTSGKAILDYTISCNGQEIESNNFKFKPAKSGTYNLKFAIKDYVKTYYVDYQIEVDDASEPIFEEINMPSTVLNNQVFDFPIPKAYAYNSGNVYEAKTHIYLNNSLINNSYKISTSNNNILNIRYEIYADELPSIKTILNYELKVITPNYLDEYFINNNFSSKRNDNYINYQTTNNDNKLTFVNDVLLNAFSFNFAVDSEHNNFNKVNIVLTDSVNRNEQIKITYQKNSNKSLVYVNDEYIGDTQATFYGSIKNFYLAIKGNSLYDSTSSIVGEINKYQNGLDFNGFSSNRIYMDINLEDVSGDSALNIYSIGNQTFYDETDDYSKPLIYVNNSFDYVYKAGTSITISDLYAYDIITKDCPINMQIRKDGISLLEQNYSSPFTYTFTEEGEYVFIFNATDGNGNKAQVKRLSFIISNNEQVEVSLTGKYSTKGQVSKEINIAKANVSSSKDYSLLTFVRNDLGVTKEIKDSFVADKPGKYVVIYVVTTSDNRQFAAEYEVEVE